MSEEKKAEEIAFSRYTSIENATNNRVLQDVVDSGLTAPSEVWVATEKVHGANFTLYTNGAEVQCAKRSSMLGWNANFHGFQTVVEEHRDRMLQCFELVRDLVPEATIVRVCGELFGGSYPHKDVKPVRGIRHVQKGVWYCPDVRFYAFDIAVRNHGFLRFDDAQRILEACGFFHAEELVRGTFEEVMAFDVETFQTTIPRRLGLPEIEPNIAEGIVLKPVESRYVRSSRAILKKKALAFAEAVHGKDYLLRKAMAAKRDPKTPKIVSEDALVNLMDPETVEGFEFIIGHVTENRLRNVISHEGNDCPEPKLIGLFVADCFADAIKDMPQIAKIKADNKKQYKLLHKGVQGRCTQMVRDNIDAVRDGSF